MRNAKADQSINISGGTFTAGSLAVGTGARAVQTTTSSPTAGTDLASVQKMLDEILALLRREASSVPGHQGVADAVTTVKEELKKETPSKLTVSSVMDGILKAVQSTAGIATAVQAAKLAVEVLLK